jgi:hypothetical protein
MIGKAEPWTPATSNPIVCNCWAARHNLMGPHHDWRAEYERNRAAGSIPDEVWFAAISVADRIDPSETAEVAQ